MQKRLIAFAAGAVLVGVAYFAYSQRSTPCDGILEQIVPGFRTKVAELTASCEWAIGKEKIQEVDKDSRKAAEHLNSCCKSRMSGLMKPEQYQVCVNGAKDYLAKIVQITTLVEEAETAMQEGKLTVMDDKVTQAQTNADALAGLVRDLGTLAEGFQSAQPAPVIDNAKP